MGRETYFPRLAYSCHNAKVVHAFESNTPFEKLPGTQINVPRLNLHSARGTAGAPLPAISCLGVFGRRPPQRVDSIVMPASENLHKRRHHYFASEIDFATARAERMNCWASGLGVRFLTVMTSTEPSTVGTLSGNISSPARLALNRATEPGSSPTNFPVATIVVVN